MNLHMWWDEKALLPLISTDLVRWGIGYQWPLTLLHLLFSLFDLEKSEMKKSEIVIQKSEISYDLSWIPYPPNLPYGPAGVTKMIPGGLLRRSLGSPSCSLWSTRRSLGSPRCTLGSPRWSLGSPGPSLGSPGPSMVSLGPSLAAHRPFLGLPKRS
jgi:hypothetical protein